MMGVSAASTFNNYIGFFTNAMQSFRVLTDASKLNKKPERVKIKTVVANSSFEQAMRYFKMPDTRMKQLGILNGMQKNSTLTKGMLIKVVEY
jgi:predicted Zn-dependent protease